MSWGIGDPSHFVCRDIVMVTGDCVDVFINVSKSDAKNVVACDRYWLILVCVCSSILVRVSRLGIGGNFVRSSVDVYMVWLSILERVNPC